MKLDTLQFKRKPGGKGESSHQETTIHQIDFIMEDECVMFTLDRAAMSEKAGRTETNCFGNLRSGIGIAPTKDETSNQQQSNHSKCMSVSYKIQTSPRLAKGFFF